MSPVVARAAWSAGWPIREALRLPIRLYRWTLAGVFGGNCRFYPSCSEYASLAIERNGGIRGLGLAVWRVLRCSPLSDGGVDPPPMGRTWRALHAQLAGVNAGVPDDDHLHGTVGVGA